MLLTVVVFVALVVDLVIIVVDEVVVKPNGCRCCGESIVGQRA
jgi:hypothetical protein